MTVTKAQLERDRKKLESIDPETLALSEVVNALKPFVWHSESNKAKVSRILRYAAERHGVTLNEFV